MSNSQRMSVAMAGAAVLLAILLRPQPSSAVGAIQEYAVPSALDTVAIASGPDRNLWFTNSGVHGDFLARITPQGVISQYPLVGSPAPRGRTTGPDRHVRVAQTDST